MIEFEWVVLKLKILQCWCIGLQSKSTLQLNKNHNFFMKLICANVIGYGSYAFVSEQLRDALQNSQV